MSKYSYKLYTNNRLTEKKYMTYTHVELLELTTFQLRNICYKEKLVTGLVNNLTRDDLIQTILRYRGTEENLLIKDKKEGGFERIEAALQAYLQTPLSDNGEIKIPAKMTLYSGLKMDERDQYYVKTGGLLAESNVFLINEHFELCGIFNILKNIILTKT